MDGIDYCEECEREHREEVKELMEQLKAKEQECETLASQLDFEVQKKECLEQECEELKKENQNLKNMYNSMSDLCEIKDEAILDKNADIEELSQHCFEYSDRIHNFKQALDEIEIYCKTAKGVATNKNDIEFFKMIIDIINKAKAEEDKQ